MSKEFTPFKKMQPYQVNWRTKMNKDPNNPESFRETKKKSGKVKHVRKAIRATRVTYKPGDILRDKDQNEYEVLNAYTKVYCGNFTVLKIKSKKTNRIFTEPLSTLMKQGYAK